MFEQPWWLEAVAPGRWAAAEVVEDGKLQARMPYVLGCRGGKVIATMPPLTQTLGVWFRPQEGGKYVNWLSRRGELLRSLIGQLPCKNVDLTLDSAVDYVLPFRWQGFRCEPSFSYRFTNLTDVEALFRGVKDSRRSEIKKAGKMLTVRDDRSVDVLIDMMRCTFRRQGRQGVVDEALVRRLDEACREHHASRLLVAEDADGRVQGAAYFVYDARCCYYLAGGANPEYRGSGAQSLLIWEGIKFASSVSRMFDFEGSMIEDIERNFRSFGSGVVVNYRVRRLGLLPELMDAAKPYVKRLIGYKN